MGFAPHMRTIFNAMGVPVVYTPPSGPTVSCKAMRATKPLRYGSTDLPVEGVCLDLLRADVTPVVGGSITVGGALYAVDVPPIPFPADQDPEGLRWRLLCGWGSAVTYRSVSGSGASQNPPQGGPWAIGASAVAGATTLSIKATYTVGRLVPGDRFSIAGDATVYTVGGSGPQAATNQFATVPITPALAAPASAGAAVTFSFVRDVSVRAALVGYAADQLLGGVQVGDRRLIIPAGSLSAAGLPDEPKAGDIAFIGGRSRNVQVATAAHQAGGPVLWELLVRGG